MIPSSVYPLAAGERDPPGAKAGKLAPPQQEKDDRARRRRQSATGRKRPLPPEATTIGTLQQQHPAPVVSSRDPPEGGPTALANSNRRCLQTSSSSWEDQDADDEGGGGSSEDESSKEEQRPFFRPISPSALAASNAVMPQQQQFLVFVKILLHQLEKEDTTGRLKPMAKARLQECIVKNRQGLPDYQPLQEAAQKRLLPLVGLRHWNRSVQYLTLFLHKQQQRQHLQQLGGQDSEDGPAIVSA